MTRIPGEPGGRGGLRRGRGGRGPQRARKRSRPGAGPRGCAPVPRRPGRRRVRGPRAERLACCQPPGFVLDATDCDDEDPQSHPDGQEVCDIHGADEDCDGLVNEADDSVDASQLLRLYTDADGDGFADPDVSREACSSGPDEVDVAMDCDDGDAAVHPDAVEVCDASGVDEDCD